MSRTKYSKITRGGTNGAGDAQRSNEANIDIETVEQRSKKFEQIVKDNQRTNKSNMKRTCWKYYSKYRKCKSSNCIQGFGANSLIYDLSSDQERVTSFEFQNILIWLLVHNTMYIMP